MFGWGIYEQEIGDKYLDMPLGEAIERIYLDRKLPISDTKVRALMNNYLFTEGDRNMIVRNLSGGQKARLQIINMLANEPNLIILDEADLAPGFAQYRGVGTGFIYLPWGYDLYFPRQLLPSQTGWRSSGN